ncbi:permease [Gemmatirosa kalamazoonensis]|uniref:Permease n=1 Tax=Gemmatirosa kalamazoonensis TaxID=861299 RepID=W0RGV6_9BACT|nr:ADOP family duplicated permease [Gemmatirosa kalamazoonensis]AHG89565.1 permease [Gemmatirosa kalamazoonensis]
MSHVLQDVRLALRGLRRAPAFTAAVLVVLALGIGMASAMVTVYDAVLRRPLPVRDQDRLVAPRTYDKAGVELALWPEELEQLGRDSRTMRGVGGFAHWGSNETPLRDGDRALVLNRSVVAGPFFDVLGARPTLGRLLRPEDHVKGAPPVLVLSYAAWRRDFGGDPRVVGRKLREPYQQTWYTIVGVAPAGLDYPLGTDYWMPLGGFARSLLSVVARLAPGATPAAARAEYLAFSRRVDEKHPVRFAPVRAEAPLLVDAIGGDARPMLAALTAAVALLLAIACVNVGNLLLLRATGRARELAVRRALGAGPGAVARMLVVESALLGVVGGALGLACATVLLRALVAVAPAKLPRVDVVSLAGAPVAIAAGVTALAVLLFGVAPALVATRGALAALLRHDARSGRESIGRRRVRHALVAVQVALALVTLAGAGLLARSLRRLERQPLGYTPTHLAVLTLATPVPQPGPPKVTPGGTIVDWVTLGEQLLARLEALPGVVAATPVVVPPFVGTNVFNVRLAPADAPDPLAVSAMMSWEIGGPHYFATLGTPLIRGRGFSATDVENAPPVAVVSESLARRFWGDGDPIGRRLRAPGDTSAVTIIGVAADTRLRSLRDPAMVIYYPWRQGYWQGLFAIRTDRDLALVLPSVRRLLHDVDPRIDLWRAQTMDDYLAGPLAQPRLSTVLLSGFGVVALLLAAIGLYGVMASAVREQTREIGVRMTLGATPSRVRGDVLRRALAVAGVGAVAGLAGALVGTRLLASQLYEVTPTDPLALLGACALLLAVALVAAFVPARSATRVDPARALRAE